MQRGSVMTLAASEKSAFERVVRSEMLENAPGDCNAGWFWAAASSLPTPPAAMPDVSASATDKDLITASSCRWVEFRRSELRPYITAAKSKPCAGAFLPFYRAAS